MTDCSRKYRAAHPDRVAAFGQAYRDRQKRIETYKVYVGDEVVYVGRTNYWKKRLQIHRYMGSPWVKEMTKVIHYFHSSYADSLVSEALLIREHQPRYNLAGVTQ